MSTGKRVAEMSNELEPEEAAFTPEVYRTVLRDVQSMPGLEQRYLESQYEYMRRLEMISARAIALSVQAKNKWEREIAARNQAPPNYYRGESSNPTLNLHFDYTPYYARGQGPHQPRDRVPLDFTTPRYEGGPLFRRPRWEIDFRREYPEGYTGRARSEWGYQGPSWRAGESVLGGGSILPEMGTGGQGRAPSPARGGQNDTNSGIEMWSPEKKMIEVVKLESDDEEEDPEEDPEEEPEYTPGIDWEYELGDED